MSNLAMKRTGHVKAMPELTIVVIGNGEATDLAR